MQQHKMVDENNNRSNNSRTQLLFDFSRDGCLKEIVELVSDVPQSERKLLAEKTFDDQWSLFIATLNGHLDVVDFLCSECGVDINRSGSFKLQQQHSSLNSDVTIHFVSSFWVACVKGHLDIVKLLHEKYHADVDTRSDSYSTALRSACYMSNYEICKYLLEKKANPNSSNLMGGTPLINSIQSLGLVKLLVDHQVDVNYQDFTGTTALHYAIQEFQHTNMAHPSTNSIDVIKLLVQSGANPRLRNMYNEDAYRLAAMKGDKQVLLYLIENTQPSIDVIVENLRLIGSFCMDFNENATNALLLWQRAIRLQCASTTTASSDIVEATSSGDEAFYKNINDKYAIGLRANSDRNLNDHNLYKYSCLVRSQILGKYHRESIYALMKRGAFYADLANYKLSIEYWHYALDLTLSHKTDARQLEMNKTLSNIIVLNEYEFYFHESMFIINSLISLYIEMYKSGDNEADRKLITHENQLKLFKAIETQLLDLIDHVHEKPICYQYAKNFHELLRSLLNCVNLVFNFDFKENLTVKQELYDYMRRFIRQYASKLRSPYKFNSTLLHVCFHKSTTNPTLLINSTNVSDLSPRLDLLSKFAFPNLNVLKFLLNSNCGFHLNMKNNENETPLFILVKKYIRTLELYSAFDEVTRMKLNKHEFELVNECIQYALNNGAHIDLHDSSGNELSNLLTANEFYINQLKYVKLSCLCANVIKRFNIKYDSEDLPVELRNFIEIH